MRLLVVIPAYNEAENLERFVEELKEKAPGVDFVVVNDGSADETAEICRRNGYPLLDLPSNLGLTGAFQTGMRYALEQGYDAAMQMDGDGQHEPRFIPAMAERMAAEDLDLVIGSRFVTQKRPATLRMFGNALISAAIRLTTGKRIMDPTSGMRMYGRRVLPKMADGINFSPEPDTLAWLLRKGARLAEVQVEMRERIAGESYLSLGNSIRYMAQMCMNIFVIQWIRKE